MGMYIFLACACVALIVWLGISLSFNSRQHKEIVGLKNDIEYLHEMLLNDEDENARLLNFMDLSSFPNGFTITVQGLQLHGTNYRTVVREHMALAEMRKKGIEVKVLQ